MKFMNDILKGRAIFRWIHLEVSLSLSLSTKIVQYVRTDRMKFISA